MTLTLADVERWDAGAVREVSSALAKRGASADEVRAGLTKLPIVAAWQGSGGDAARASLDKLSAYLAAHGLEMARLSSATGEASDEIERIKAGLQRLRDDAQRLGFSIDTATGEVNPLHPDMVGDPIYALQQADLQVRVAELLTAADTADSSLARAITTAGEAPTQLPPIPDPLAAPLPEDPEQFHDFWQRLTPEQKDLLYRRDHSIGNRDGMPAVDRDYFNRLALADEVKKAETAQATADALRAEHPDWAAGQNIPPPNKPGAIFDERLRYEAWQRRYDAARSGAEILPDLAAVDRAIDEPDRKLLLLDTKTGEMVHAAVAIGDPDTADKVAVTAPGLNTTVRDSLVGMTEEAVNLQRETYRQLSLSPGHELESVSTIAWIGYDTPQIPGFDDKSASLSGAWDVSHGQLAQAGARDLAGFYDGLTASHEGVPAQLTAIGHSYGSLTTGLALQEPGDHGVTDAIFYGSPGIMATNPADLQLPDGHVFTMQAPDDPIRHVFDAPLLHAATPLLPEPLESLAESTLRTMELTGAGQFGPDPAANPNFTHLETGAVNVPDGSGGTLNLGAAQGHSEYPRFGDDGTPRTTNYNIAAVVAGLQDDAIRQK
ncbi:alpha/beta hydrolase [Mycolicibacterium celeriflavum]|uniref:alpha/beta hydrolase n=1 Tax=Mycolicibacterium celeriflavum TaxID=1249101 RepID=UPI003CFA6097